MLPGHDRLGVPESCGRNGPEDTKPKKSISKRFKLLTLLQLFIVIAVVAGGWFHFRPQESVSSPSTPNRETAGGLVEGILHSPDSPSALIDGQVVRIGDSFYGVEIVAIERSKVTFRGNGSQWEQRVRQRPDKAWSEPASGDK